MYMKPIKIIECPRDAMQGWPKQIPTAVKVAYINSLLRVGFDTLDMGSFVSPKAIPQMADTAEVLSLINTADTHTKLLTIVANLRGAEAAMAFNSINYLGFPFSISPTFQLRNTNSTMQDSMERVAAIQQLCTTHQKQLVIYLSMGFGNPYGDTYNETVLLDWAAVMAQMGIGIISLADTVGLATADQVKQALEVLIPKYPQIEFGVHLHSAQSNRAAKLQAALDAGCQRFDGAIGGIGGCPMAQNDLIGNMDTSFMIDYFKQQQIPIAIEESVFEKSKVLSSQIFS
ncbi:hydroxymethylglutaryl-CoA lyase [Panacibacter sp. KCS-6]|uniref:Hydroxymethylglutaryl-CoA lyase n=2 Tax=Limnovirga soli TaxID=2656915 RepID=A0A8J8JT33_9BACT|nr:hydroxymethylglutaryl-CoA lyase [Limnovirga soli]